MYIKHLWLYNTILGSLKAFSRCKPTTYGLKYQKWRNTYHQFQEKGRENEKRRRKVKNEKVVKNCYSR